MVDLDSALCLGAALNSELVHRKHKYAMKVALNKPQEGYSFTTEEPQQEGREHGFLALIGNVHVGG